MTRTELQELKEEYATGNMDESEFEGRLDTIDLDEEAPTWRERNAPLLAVLQVVGFVAAGITLIIITKGQILFVAPALIVVAALLYGYYKYVQWSS